MTARRWVTLAGCVAAAAALVGGLRRPPPLTSEEPLAVLPVPASAPETPVTLAPPTPVDVRAAIARAFSGFVKSPAEVPVSAAGDWNGDGWQDVAVVVEPTEERLHAINDDLRNWIVEDLGRTRASLGPSRSVRVEKGERLVAVVHGHGPAGVRSNEARQAYLLKSVAGARLGFLRKDEVASANHPKLRGDVIVDGTQPAERFLYWTGARYAAWP